MTTKLALPVIFVLGCPASGKATLCKRLEKEYALAHFSVAEILRSSASILPNPTLEAALESGELPADVNVLLFSMLKSQVDELVRIPQGKEIKAVLLDGYPRSLKQLQEFTEKFGQPWFTLNLSCPKDIALERFLKRKRSATDDEEKFEKRYKQFLEDHKEVLNDLIEGRVAIWLSTADDTDATWGRLQDALSAISGVVATKRAK